MSREPSTPPSGPVLWEVFAVGRADVTGRVEARSWYEARALGEQLLGRQRGEVDARRVGPEANGTETGEMDMGGCCEPVPPTLGSGTSPGPERKPT
jgi:hypothetical protein